MPGKIPWFLQAWLAVALVQFAILAARLPYRMPAWIAIGVAVILLWAYAFARRSRTAWFVWLYLTAMPLLSELGSTGARDVMSYQTVGAVLQIALLVNPHARAWFERRTESVAHS